MWGLGGPFLTFPAGCICTGSWGEANSPGAGCRAWGCMGRREDCGEESQDRRQPGAPLGLALPLTSRDSILTESEKPVCGVACSICFCRDRAPPGWRNPRTGRGGCCVRQAREGEGGEGRRADRGVFTCLGGLEVAVHRVGLWLRLRQVLHCRERRRCWGGRVAGTAVRTSLGGSRRRPRRPLPVRPPLTSELLTGAVGRLRGAVVRRGLSRPIGAARAALELAVLRGPREGRRRAHVVPGLREDERARRWGLRATPAPRCLRPAVRLAAE